MKIGFNLFMFLLALNHMVFANENTSDFTPDFWQKIKPYDKEQIVERVDFTWSAEKIRELAMNSPARFISTDPMSDSYPNLTPYHYSLNNPIRFIDPTGMWVAEYNEDGNIVNAIYEEGDTYEDLYAQLGISADQFSEQFGIDLSKGITQTSFDITGFVLSNTNFNSNESNSNCFGFVATATGIQATENQVQGVNFLSTIGNPSSTTKPITGDIAIWEYTGDINGAGKLGKIQGNPAHSAIFILNNQAGAAQFLNRTTTGAPVTVTNASRVIQSYQAIRIMKQNNINAANLGWVLPSISNSPNYYKMR